MNPEYFYRSKMSIFTKFPRLTALLIRYFPILSIALILLLIGIVFVQTGRQTAQMNKLNAQHEEAQIAYTRAIKNRKTSLMAVSVANELAGWKNKSIAASFFLKKLSEIPQGDLLLQDLFFIQYFRLRNLPESQRNPFGNMALTLSGEILLEVCEAQKGCGKYAFPHFLEEIQQGVNFPLTYEQEMSQDEAPPTKESRILNITFPIEYLRESAY